MHASPSEIPLVRPWLGTALIILIICVCFQMETLTSHKLIIGTLCFQFEISCILFIEIAETSELFYNVVK